MRSVPTSRRGCTLQRRRSQVGHATVHRSTMSIQMDPPRSPVPAVAQALAEAALQRQNMLLGADKGASGVVVPGAGSSTGGVPPLPTPNPAAPLAPPPLPEGASDPALAVRVSLSPRASQALQGHWRPRATAGVPKGWRDSAWVRVEHHPWGHQRRVPLRRGCPCPRPAACFAAARRLRPAPAPRRAQGCEGDPSGWT